MGDCNEDLSLPVKSAAGTPTIELRLSKHVYDSVRGNIYLDPGMVELDTDRYDLQTVRRAGLLHGPFSQTFEREFFPRVISGCAWSQELMGVNMIYFLED